MIEELNRIHETMITKFPEMSCLSLAINAAPIEQRHFLDLMVLALHPKIKSFRSDAIEKTTLTAEDDRNIGMAAMKQLYRKIAHQHHG
jgi:hypothetical protein